MKFDQINMIEQMDFEFQLEFGTMAVCFSGKRTKIASSQKIVISITVHRY